MPGLKKVTFPCRQSRLIPIFFHYCIKSMMRLGPVSEVTEFLAVSELTQQISSSSFDRCSLLIDCSLFVILKTFMWALIAFSKPPKVAIGLVLPGGLLFSRVTIYLVVRKRLNILMIVFNFSFGTAG